MAHSPSSTPKFLVTETGTRNFARVPCILVPDFLVAETWVEQDNVLFITRNLDARDSNAALLLATEICYDMIHRTGLSSANNLALLIYSLILIIANFYYAD